MAKIEGDLLRGIQALPAFPLELVTAGRNIMTAAAFSFYSFKPPCVMVGIMPRNYTFELMLQKLEFGINIPTERQLDAARFCGSVSGREVDKFKKTGLAPQKGKAVESLLVKECPVNLECNVVNRIGYKGSHRWFVGRVEAVHIEQDYTRDQALMYWPKEYRRVGDVILKVERKGKH